MGPVECHRDPAVLHLTYIMRAWVHADVEHIRALVYTAKVSHFSRATNGVGLQPLAPLQTNHARRSSMSVAPLNDAGPPLAYFAGCLLASSAAVPLLCAPAPFFPTSPLVAASSGSSCLCPDPSSAPEAPTEESRRRSVSCHTGTHHKPATSVCTRNILDPRLRRPCQRHPPEQGAYQQAQNAPSMSHDILSKKLLPDVGHFTLSADDDASRAQCWSSTISSSKPNSCSAEAMSRRAQTGSGVSCVVGTDSRCKIVREQQLGSARGSRHADNGHSP